MLLLVQVGMVAVIMVAVVLGFVALVATTVLALVRPGPDAADLASAARLSMSQVGRIVPDTQGRLAGIVDAAPRQTP